MKASEKPKLLTTRNKKIQNHGSNWNLWGFCFLISFPPALILTIIFYLSGIKTLFWSEQGTSRHPWFRGYIAVFFLLWIFIVFTIIILHILFFLLKILLQKKSRNQQKKASKYMLIFLSNQLLLNLFLFFLWKQKSKSTIIMIMLISLLLIIINSFFIHYFFSKPVMKLLIKKYPRYFPKVFHQETKLMMKVDSMEFKKTQTTEWAIIITLILVNFWILLQLFYLKIT